MHELTASDVLRNLSNGVLELSSVNDFLQKEKDLQVSSYVNITSSININVAMEFCLVLMWLGLKTHFNNTYTHMHTRTHTCTHARVHALSRAHAHTHTHTRWCA